jgi:antitoxin ChpS
VFTTKLRKVGGSVMLAIPPAVLDMLQLQPGEAVGLSVDAGHLVVDPQVRPHYTLDELLWRSATPQPTSRQRIGSGSTGNRSAVNRSDRARRDLYRFVRSDVRS